MTTDHDAVILARYDRLDEAELAQAAFERAELVLADPAGVGGVEAEEVDRDLFDGDEAERRAGHATYHAKLASSNSGRVPKAPWGHAHRLSKNGRAGGIQSIVSN
ncbi:MAG TPA: hypothetical protein VIK38_06780 [Coriobacteriia bacterium]